MEEQQKDNRCLFVALGALIIFLSLIYVFPDVAQAQADCWSNCWQSCGPQAGTYVEDSCCPAPFNDTCIGHAEGFRMGNCQYSVPSNCSENDSWLDCPDGTKIWADTYLEAWGNGICTSAIEDCLGKQCYCFEYHGGDCSGGGGGGGGGPTCELQNLTLPASVCRGDNFQISYQFRTTDWSQRPYVFRAVETSLPLTPAWCEDNQSFSDNNWRTDTVNLNSAAMVDESSNIRVRCESDWWAEDWCPNFQNLDYDAIWPGYIQVKDRCAPDTSASCCAGSTSLCVDTSATTGTWPGSNCLGASANSCWALGGGFTFPNATNDEIYNPNCCGDDTGEYFVSASGIRQGSRVITTNNRSCDGTMACCRQDSGDYNGWVQGGQCLSVCSPGQPSNLRHTANTTSSITWAWDAGVGNTYYRAFVYNMAGALITQNLNVAGTSWQVNALAANTRYQLLVQGCNAGDCSALAGPVNAETAMQDATSVTCSNITATAMTVTANGPFSNITAGNSGIHFSRQKAGEFIIYPWNFSQSTNWSMSGLTPNTAYTFKVQSCNSDCSEFHGDFGPFTSTTVCQTLPPSENCTDGIDNDGDSKIDCQDSDCPCPVCRKCSGISCVADAAQNGNSCGSNSQFCTLDVCQNGACVAGVPRDCNSQSGVNPCPDRCALDWQGVSTIPYRGSKRAVLFEVLDPSNKPILYGGPNVVLSAATLPNIFGACAAQINNIWHYDIAGGDWKMFVPGAPSDLNSLETNKVYFVYLGGGAGSCLWLTDGTAGIGDYCNRTGQTCLSGACNSAENCSNGVDDDCDAKKDNEDNDCAFAIPDTCRSCRCDEANDRCECFSLACGNDTDGCCPDGCDYTLDQDCPAPATCDPDIYPNAECCNNTAGPKPIENAVRWSVDGLGNYQYDYNPNKCGGGSCYFIAAKFPETWDANVTIKNYYGLCCQDDANEFYRSRVCYQPVGAENPNLAVCNSDAGDRACCNNDKDCLYNGQCYSITSVQTTFGLPEPAVCSSGVWQDCDRSSVICNTLCDPAIAKTVRWTQGAQATAFGEYDTGLSTECCGDDADENLVTVDCDGNTDPTGFCCSNARPFVQNNKCVAACNQAPFKPMVVCPFDETTGNGGPCAYVSGNVPPEDAAGSGTGPTLRWQPQGGGAPDPDGDTVTYTLYFGDVNPPSFLTTVNAINGINMRDLASSLQSNKTYYWGIVAIDSKGKVTGSDTWRFKTQSNVPPQAKANCVCPATTPVGDCNAATCTAYTSKHIAIGGMLLNANGSSDFEDCPSGYPNLPCNLTCNWSVDGGFWVSNCGDNLYSSTSPANYVFNLTVLDSGGLSASAAKTLSLRRDVWANFECCFGPDMNVAADCNVLPVNGGWQDCSLIIPKIGKDKIWLIASPPQSRASDGASLNEGSYNWTFPGSGIIPPGDTSGAIVGWFKMQIKQVNLSLTVTDSVGRYDTITKTIKAEFLPPGWQED